MEPFAKLSAPVCELARQAGAHIMRFYGDCAAVTWKKDASPLTAADRASHDFLVESLKSVLPEATVVSEESNEAMNSSVDGAALFWLVDPLDGTKEFLKGQMNLPLILPSSRTECPYWESFM